MAQQPLLLNDYDYSDFGVALPNVARAVQERKLPPPPKTVAQTSHAQGASTIPAARAAEDAQVPPAPDAYTTQMNELMDRRRKLMAQQAEIDKPADYTQQSQYMRDRSQSYLPNAMAAVALGMGPQAAQPLAKLVAGQAEQSITPMKVEGGFIDTGGSVQVDPGFALEKRRTGLRDDITAVDKQIGTNLSEREKRIEYARQQSENRDLRRDIAEMTGRRRGDGGGGGGEGGGGKLSAPNVVTPDGDEVAWDGRSMQRMIMQDGKRVPYNGPMMSREAFEKQIGAAQSLLGSRDALASLEQKLRANPKAFGGVSSVASLLHPVIGSRLSAAKLTPEEQRLKALVLAEAATIVHELYGAAQSAQETKSAVAFIPTATDPPERVLQNLKSLIAWQESKMRQYGPRMIETANRRRGASSETARGPTGPAGSVDFQQATQGNAVQSQIGQPGYTARQPVPGQRDVAY